MKLKCNCEIVVAGKHDEIVNLEDDTQTKSVIFCEVHHKEIQEIIKRNGGHVIGPAEEGVITAGELPIKALNAVEEFVQNLVMVGLDELYGRKLKPEEYN
jgi:hypothetical protein